MYCIHSECMPDTTIWGIYTQKKEPTLEFSKAFIFSGLMDNPAQHTPFNDAKLLYFFYICKFFSDFFHYIVLHFFKHGLCLDETTNYSHSC